MSSLFTIGPVVVGQSAGYTSTSDSTARQQQALGAGSTSVDPTNATQVVLPASTGAQSSGADHATTGKEANAKDLQKAVDKVSQVVGLYTTKLNFSIDDDTKTVVVKVINEQNNEVIRQIPSEEMLKLAKSLDSIVGMFVKNTA